MDLIDWKADLPGRYSVSEMLLVKVVTQRVVEGDLSRIHLRAMYGFAKHAKVPLDQFSSDSPAHKVAPELVTLSNMVLTQALQNKLAPELLQAGNINRARYVHYSAEIGTTAALGMIYPNEPAKKNRRAIYPCKEETT